MTYYVSSGTLNPTHSLTIIGTDCIRDLASILNVKIDGLNEFLKYRKMGCLCPTSSTFLMIQESRQYFVFV